MRHPRPLVPSASSAPCWRSFRGTPRTTRLRPDRRPLRCREGAAPGGEMGWEGGSGADGWGTGAQGPQRVKWSSNLAANPVSLLLYSDVRRAPADAGRRAGRRRRAAAAARTAPAARVTATPPQRRVAPPPRAARRQRPPSAPTPPPPSARPLAPPPPPPRPPPAPPRRASRRRAACSRRRSGEFVRRAARATSSPIAASASQSCRCDRPAPRQRWSTSSKSMFDGRPATSHAERCHESSA